MVGRQFETNTLLNSSSPGHRGTLQRVYFTRVLRPEHGLPPLAGAGLVQDLTIVSVVYPTPHVTEHLDVGIPVSRYSLQPPLTGYFGTLYVGLWTGQIERESIYVSTCLDWIDRLILFMSSSN